MSHCFNDNLLTFINGFNKFGIPINSMPLLINIICSFFQGTNPMVPAKRQRVLSGIYPIIPKEPPKITYEIIQSVGFRRQDGKISKINAVVQKRSEIPQIQVTVQDIINKSITQTLSNPYVNTETGTNLTYSNINAQDVDALKTEMLRSNVDEKNEICNNIDQRNDKYGMVDRNEGHSNIDNRNDRYGNSDQRNERYDSNMEGTECPYSVYYHKKIRGEQVRSQRSYQREVSREEERLPTIDSVFSRFNAHTDVTQPIYVQVSDESERCKFFFTLKVFYLILLNNRVFFIPKFPLD